MERMHYYTLLADDDSSLSSAKTNLFFGSKELKSFCLQKSIQYILSEKKK